MYMHMLAYVQIIFWENTQENENGYFWDGTGLAREEESCYFSLVPSA